MKKGNENKSEQNNIQTSEGTNKPAEKAQITEKAREEALDDIEQDPDLSVHHPNDDLDEGETARLGEDKTDLV